MTTPLYRHRIGLPHANILEGIKEEHCNMPNSNYEFESVSCKITDSLYTGRQE